MRNAVYRSLALGILAACLCGSAHAWNALGHKVIAEIAWQRIDEDQRAEIVATLRRHPRFDEDFAQRIDEPGDDGRLIFLHASTWPDIARGIRGPDRALYDMGPWHYVNFPLLIDDTRPPESVNLTTGQPSGEAATWNVIQATRYALACLDENTASPQKRALAYCWLFHLVGDMHQPMHSTALFCERFPEGDRGGNSIPLRQGGNLHRLWDNLLGRQHRLADVLREYADLEADSAGWEIDTTSDIAEWVGESHRLAQFAYHPAIRSAVKQPGELQPIDLPEEYLTSAGEIARRRVIAAGMRLAALLQARKPGG